MRITIELYGFFTDFDDNMIAESVKSASENNVKVNIMPVDESVQLTGTHPDIFSFLCEFHAGQSINENEMNEMIENSVIFEYVMQAR